MVTPMARTPINASTEIFSIVPLKNEDIVDKANYKFHDRYNNSLETFSAEAVDGFQQQNYSNDPTNPSDPADIYLNARLIQDIHELNKTALNSTDEQEHVPTEYDKTYTVSNWTDTKTTEAPLLGLPELNNSFAYMTINLTGPKLNESNENLPHIQTSNNKTGKAELFEIVNHHQDFQVGVRKPT